MKPVLVTSVPLLLDHLSNKIFKRKNRTVDLHARKTYYAYYLLVWGKKSHRDLEDALLQNNVASLPSKRSFLKHLMKTVTIQKKNRDHLSYD